MSQKPEATRNYPDSRATALRIPREAFEDPAAYLPVSAIMFPVEKVDVFAEVRPGQFSRFRGRKALINATTGEVLSVVSGRYQVLTNEEALSIAIKVCTKGFPTARPEAWRISAVMAPDTRGHCRFDLQHPDFPSLQVGLHETWELLVRITNSYNHTRAFKLNFAFVCFTCENRVLVSGGEVLKVAVDHNTPGIVEAIESRIEALDLMTFGLVVTEFHRLVGGLLKVHVPSQRFRPILLSALRIRKPEGLVGDRQTDWTHLERMIDRIRDRYIDERGLGETAYALFQTMTDLATHSRRHDHGRFIRRDRHSLQQLAGEWLKTFHELSRSGSSLADYIENPSWSALSRGTVPRTGRR